MNHDEIKFLLSGFRKGQNYEIEDPKIAEALDHANSDKDLQAWLKEQQDIDNTVVEALKKVTPHSALKNEIMAGGEMVRRARKRRFFRNIGLLATAALLVIGFTIFEITRDSQQSTFASVEEVTLTTMANLDSGTVQLDVMADGRTIGDLIKVAFNDPSIQVAPGLSNLSAKGCKEFTVGDHSVCIVCFNHQGVLHHFAMIDKPENLSDYTREAETLASKDHWNGKKWKDNDFGYLLLTDARNPISSIESIDI